MSIYKSKSHSHEQKETILMALNVELHKVGRFVCCVSPLTLLTLSAGGPEITAHCLSLNVGVSVCNKQLCILWRECV